MRVATPRAIPQLLGSVYLVWPIVRERVVVREVAFPSFQTPILVPQLRSIGAPLHWPEADRFGTHSLLLGAARALMFAGGTFAQLPGACQWRGNAVRFYLDLDEGERRAMADILIRS